MNSDVLKKAIKAGVCIIALALILILVITNIAEYDSKGEVNMPFELSKIVVMSTAEGMENKEENTEAKWKFNVIQNNDVYITISKNENYNKEDIIKSVKIENIQIKNGPKEGAIKVYMPNSSDGRLFTYSDNYVIEESVEYRGATTSNPKTLEIGNQGGNVLISFVNTGLGTYESTEDTEIKHDGTLVAKMGKTEENLKFTASFDLVISVKNKSYRTNINIEMPSDGLFEKGISTNEITNKEQFVFKREKLKV